MTPEKTQQKRWLQHDLHALAGGADFGIVVARVGDNFVDDDVGVVGIVVVEDQFLGAAFHDYVDGLTPMAMSPATASSFVLFGKILRIVDQNVGAFSQLAHGFVEVGITGFIIRCVDQHAFFGFEAKSHAALRVVEPCGLDLDAVAHGQASIFDIVEVALGFHLVEVDRKIGRSHLLGKNLLQPALAPEGVKDKLAAGTVVERPKKGHALDVVPMEMRNEDMRGEAPVAELALQFVPQHAESGAAVKNINLIAQAHFDAGGVASIAQVLGLWSGRGAADAPKLNSHKVR